MLFSVFAVIIFAVGLTCIFGKKIQTSILTSFLITIVCISILISKELYFFSIIYGVIDIYTKIYLLMFFINRKQVNRSVKFRKRKKIFNSCAALIISIFISILLVLEKVRLEKIKLQITNTIYKYELNEIVVLALIISIFGIAGYVTKSNRWNKLD